MKAFVTGASGFIGGRVARKLIQQGHDVYVLARSRSGVAELEAMGAHVVRGDITDVESMREAMAGSDVVYHIAGWYKIGARDRQQGWHTNVDGTRSVLELAYALGVPRIVYTSTVAVFGNTRGRPVDESYVMMDDAFATEYDRTKWAAHYEVALPLIRKGAPIIIVMPGGVFGPGDNSLVGDAMRYFYQGRLPVLPGPDTLWTYAYVDDIAAGHILAAEKGRIGESYVLAGPAMSFGDLVGLWAKVSGKPAPLFGIPSRYLRPWAPLIGLANALVPLPAIFSEEATRTLGMSYLASAAKAREELGWQPRPVEEGLAETFAWLAQTAEETRPAIAPGAAIAGLALGALLAVLLIRRLTRRAV